ncbi:ESCRT-0 subunit protein hse1 [Gonapodya sp. JEL0774]|nr:ESCRT-0 subunit protein hse1 [Gonapodya sp. JEL0774]
MSKLETLVDKATDENNTAEDWGAILEITDSVKTSDSARTVVVALTSRVQHRSSNVLVVADAIVKNCGIVAHRELVSRAFLDALKTRLSDKSLHESARNKILESIQNWAKLFSSDASLGLIQETYRNLMAQGHRFPASSKPPVPTSKPTALASKAQSTEDEELQLALAISLSEAEAAKSKPSLSKPAAASSPPKPAPATLPSTFKVRALYDFTGDASQGELPLVRGDVITVTDQTYKDWWKGETRSRVGFFPANYVELLPKEATADPEAERSVLEGVRDVDRFLMMLEKVDPTRENLSENEQLLELHHSIVTLRPKLVRLIEYYSKKKEQLLDLNDKFNKAQTSYNNLVQQAVSAQRQAALTDPSVPGQGGGYYPPSVGQSQQSQTYYPQGPHITPAQQTYPPSSGYGQPYGGWEPGGPQQSQQSQQPQQPHHTQQSQQGYAGYPDPQNTGAQGYTGYGQGY